MIRPSIISTYAGMTSDVNTHHVRTYPTLGFCVRCHSRVYRHNLQTNIPCRVRCISCGYDNQVVPFEAFDCTACSMRIDCFILEHASTDL